MLTVDFDRLGLQRGERLLDMGCGGGRHAFEAMRRGAVVVALDYSAAELKDVQGVAGGMLDAGEITWEQWGGVCNGDALDLPFPDGSFDRIITSEVLEHIWGDDRAIEELVRVLRPGGRLAVTVPTRWPERVCWALDHEYHDTPGGHVRVYRQHELEQKLERAGLFLRGSHHAHALHSPYWWLRCAFGVHNPDAPLPRRYHDFLVHCIVENPRWARLLERSLNPVLGKSLVIYTEKVAPGQARRASPERRMTARDLPRVDGVLTADEIAETVDSIARYQQPDGNIPWFPGHHTDPWNLVEAAMALIVGGRMAEAERAFAWLRKQQRPDGAWHAYYQGDAVKDPVLDTNVTCYVANGVWHHFLTTRDRGFLEEYWPVVERAIDFALDHQAPTGEIAWSADPTKRVWSSALLTGSSSIHSSIRCAIAIAEELGCDRPDWELSVASLAIAIAHRPDGFLNKDRWAMDWYYPVLGGVLRGDAAHARLAKHWDTFVVEGRGVRCVSDAPWITAAETCELVMALDAVGLDDKARELFTDVQFLRADDGGGYWTGMNFDGERWAEWGDYYPEEQPSWNMAAVVLAADVLDGSGPTAGLFRGDGLPAGLTPDELIAAGVKIDEEIRARRRARRGEPDPR